MNQCKYLKQKLSRTLYCKKLKKEIILKDCTNCNHKEYKKKTNYHALKKTRQKSKKLTKLEKDRFSILVNPTKCCICSATANLTWHEVFRGKNRTNSMKYGLCLRMCLNCHEEYQENKEFNEYWHKKAQAIFVKTYPDLDFLKIFKRNYL